MTNAKQSPAKMLLLGFQHVFAMFGATVLVPTLTGLSVSATLLFAGLGTLLFHLITKRKVPAFLGSSFAFLGGYFAVNSLVSEFNAGLAEGATAVNWIPYAGVGVACAGLLYVILSGLFKAFGPSKVMRFFPPIVTGPIIICIGITLANSAINNCAANWPVALLAVAIVVVCNIWGKGMIKIIPILLGVVIPYVVALVFRMVDFSGLDVQGIFGGTTPLLGFQPFVTNFSGSVAKFDVSAILVMAPIAIASMMEHIGDMSAISATVGENFIEDPGLHRTLIGDGIATSLSAMFGGPANTTYGENTGVLVLSRVHDPKVIRLAALYAVILSFSPAFAYLVNTIPAAIIGGVSFILYGMISAIGVRNVVENQVDFTNSRNLIIAAVILVCGLGFTGGLTFTVGGASITLTSLAIAAIAGIVLNAILPGNDFHFGKSANSDASANLGQY